MKLKSKTQISLITFLETCKWGQNGNINRANGRQKHVDKSMKNLNTILNLWSKKSASSNWVSEAGKLKELWISNIKQRNCQASVSHQVSIAMDWKSFLKIAGMPTGLSTIHTLVGRRAFYHDFPVTSTFYSHWKNGYCLPVSHQGVHPQKLVAAKENSSSPPDTHTTTTCTSAQVRQLHWCCRGCSTFDVRKKSCLPWQVNNPVTAWSHLLKSGCSRKAFGAQRTNYMLIIAYPESLLMLAQASQDGKSQWTQDR